MAGLPSIIARSGKSRFQPSMIMISLVFRTTHNLQVSNTVIRFIVVYVVNYLCREEFSPKMFFQKYSVMSDGPTASKHGLISIYYSAASQPFPCPISTIESKHTFLIAEKPQLVPIYLAHQFINFFAAVTALKNKFVAIFSHTYLPKKTTPTVVQEGGSLHDGGLNRKDFRNFLNNYIIAQGGPEMEMSA